MKRVQLVASETTMVQAVIFLIYSIVSSYIWVRFWLFMLVILAFPAVEGQTFCSGHPLLCMPSIFGLLYLPALITGAVVYFMKGRSWIDLIIYLAAYFIVTTVEVFFLAAQPMLLQ